MRMTTDIDVRRRAAVAGAVSAALGLALTEVMGGLWRDVPSPVAAIGDVFIDGLPGWMVRAGIDQLGTGDKPFLVTMIVVISLLLGRVARNGDPEAPLGRPRGVRRRRSVRRLGHGSGPAVERAPLAPGHARPRGHRRCGAGHTGRLGGGHRREACVGVGHGRRGGATALSDRRGRHGGGRPLRHDARAAAGVPVLGGVRADGAHPSRRRARGGGARPGCGRPDALHRPQRGLLPDRHGPDRAPDLARRLDAAHHRDGRQRDRADLRRPAGPRHGRGDRHPVLRVERGRRRSRRQRPLAGRAAGRPPARRPGRRTVPSRSSASPSTGSRRGSRWRSPSTAAPRWSPSA